MKASSQNLHICKNSFKFQHFQWVTINGCLTSIKKEGGSTALSDLTLVISLLYI